MNKLLLETPIGNSEILFQKEGVSAVRAWIEKQYPNARPIIITDTNVGELYQEKLGMVFTGALTLAVSAGEESKRLEVVKQLLTELINEKVTRSDIIIGCGGGMITDLAGFVTSIYLRGLPFISMPTSLLAMVDAAIGGKTGVNLIAKNTVGTFDPAELILIDPDFLQTLPDREFRSGMAEVIKYAATLDASLAEDLEEEEPNLMTIIEKSAKAKVDIVNQDVKEGGLRRVLNFGHTFGHAIEKMSDYDLLHGEAVAIGMVLANRVAQNLGKQNPETGEKIIKLLRKFKLPDEVPGGIQVENLVDLIRKDKKRSEGKIHFVIAPELGEYEMIELSPEELVELVK